MRVGRQMFGLRASDLPPAFTSGVEIGFAFVMNGVGGCSPIPQRNCDRFSRSSLRC